MPATPAPKVGARLREERVRRGLSVRALARELGVSASLISQIETGRSQPSVSTLYAITTALGISIEDVFGPPAGGEQAARQQALLQLDSGVTWERLGQLAHHNVDFLRVTYSPGGTSSSNGGLMRHRGSEYGYLLRGELVLTLGDEELRLGAGDAVSFESSTPHRYRNDGDEPAVGIWFVTQR